MLPHFFFLSLLPHPLFPALMNPIKVESAMKKAEEEAYINPELAEQEKQKGNERYKSETSNA